MTRMLQSKYEEKFEDFKKHLKTTNSISFTTDIWSSKNKKNSFLRLLITIYYFALKNYLSLTAHYIDQSFVRHFKVLSTAPFDVSHTGDNVEQLIVNILEKFEIPLSSTHLFLRDAGSSVKKGLGINSKFVSMDCFIHKIQLVNFK
jgi:hypothetical protein